MNSNKNNLLDQDKAVHPYGREDQSNMFLNKRCLNRTSKKFKND